jgi:hypothetical protein
MLLEPHFQNAYVTRDMDRALAALRTQHNIDSFKCYEAAITVTTASGTGPARMKVALAWLGTLQYELIQPVSGLVDVYQDALRDMAANQLLRFHHVAVRTIDWNQLRDGIGKHRKTVVLEGATEGLRFVYVDARDTLGHYVEYVWMTPERWMATTRA